MPAPLASWNPARDAWETSHSHIDLFSGLSAVWSETFPSWGMWAGGVAYELPTSVRLTDASASSSLPGLPTPRATRGGSHTETVGLLPTPTTQDGANTAGPSQFERNSQPLNVVATLLPTPKATDGTKGGPNQRGSSGDLTLPSAVVLLPTPRATRGGSHTETVELLPTPTVGNVQGGNATRSGARSDEYLLPGLAVAIAEGRLLPTPTAGDAKASRNSTATRHKLPPTGVHAGDTLTDALVPKEAI